MFFNKDITVINSSDAAKAFSDSIYYRINKPDIRSFRKEVLVENVTSTVGFKAVDDNGFGYDVGQGEI